MQKSVPRRGEVTRLQDAHRADIDCQSVGVHRVHQDHPTLTPHSMPCHAMPSSLSTTAPHHCQGPFHHHHHCHHHWSKTSHHSVKSVFGIQSKMKLIAHLISESHSSLSSPSLFFHHHHHHQVIAIINPNIVLTIIINMIIIIIIIHHHHQYIIKKKTREKYVRFFDQKN